MNQKTNQPCTPDCTGRSAGCATTCAAWAEYIKRRDEEYSKRALEREVGEAVIDGRKRRKMPMRVI